MCQMLATGHGLKGALYLFLTSRRPRYDNAISHQNKKRNIRPVGGVRGSLQCKSNTTIFANHRGGRRAYVE